ncbi:hypothetical protein FRC06_010797, partial [Ceratobasidium sp. 370]
MSASELVKSQSRAAAVKVQYRPIAPVTPVPVVEPPPKAKRGRKPHPGSKSAREAMRKESHSRIEKRRREKINDTLTALRELISQGEGGARQEQSPPPSPEKEFKLELLERTVAFVKGLMERTRTMERELAELRGEPPAKRKKMATPMSSPNAGPSTSSTVVDELALDTEEDESSALSEPEPEPEPEVEGTPVPPRKMSIAALLSPAMAPALPSPPPSGSLNNASAGPNTETHMEILSLPSPEVALRRSSISTSERHPSSLKRPREVEGDEDTAAAALLLQFSSKTPMNNHSLLPNRGQSGDTFVSPVPSNRFSVWTFGRGTVIWRIWPAVLLHTCVAAVVVLVSRRTPYNLAIPNVLVTVAGVVIGFVISYRASSGYDRYWQGRTM